MAAVSTSLKNNNRILVKSVFYDHLGSGNGHILAMKVLIWLFVTTKFATSGEQNLNLKPIEFIIDGLPSFDSKCFERFSKISKPKF